MSKGALWMISSAPCRYSQICLDLVLEARLVLEEFGGDAVHAQRVRMAVAPGIEIQMQVVAGELAVDHLHAAQLDEPVAVVG